MIFEAPEYTSFEDSISHVSGWSCLCCLLLLRARLELEAGREESAFAQAMKVVRFGQRIQSCKGVPTEVARGWHIQEAGLRQIQRFLGRARGGLDALKKHDLEDNTLVVFTSDNGPWLTKKEDGGCALPLRDGKGTTYEGGVREPTVVRWPGRVPAGSACSEMVSEMDLLPTFAGLAGAAVPSDRIIDGKDIWPLMSGASGAKSPHDVLFYYRGPQLQAVRSGKWKLVLAQPKQNVATALYDLEADPGEEAKLPVSLSIFARTPAERAIRNAIQKAVADIVQMTPGEYYRH